MTRKRAQSLGLLRELAEEDVYQYEELNRQDEHMNDQSSTYWQDRIRQVRSESGSPKLGGRCSATVPEKDGLPRAKSTHEVGVPASAAMPTPVTRFKKMTGSNGGHCACSEWAGPIQQGARQQFSKQRPTSFHYNLTTLEGDARSTPRAKLAVNQLPDLLSSARDTPRRPQSSYDLKV